MTDHVDDTMRGDDAVLAAEYVLHLLPDADRVAAEERLAIDGGFRALVARWSEDFVQLADAVDPVEPPETVRDRLAAFVGTGEGAAAGQAATADRPRKGFSLGRFFGGGFGGLSAAAVAVVLLAVAVPQVEPPYSGPFFEGEIGDGFSDVYLTAFVDPRYHTLTLEVVSGGPPEGRVLEAWVIPEGADAPISLGVLDGSSTTIVVPDDLAPSVKAGTLAISDEPPGGSPTGAPTGQVLATGTVTET